jgi:hypothetical protein
MKKSLLTSVLILLAGIALGQELKANWSDKEYYTNKTTGFFDDFVGGNSKYVYVRSSKRPAFATGSGKKGEKKSRINMIAYDKTTMKEVANKTILDLSDGATKKKYGDLRYYKTIVFENSLYVFWITDEKKKDELYVESYDPKLKRLNPLKKIYELTSSKENTRKAEIFALGNQKAGEKIIIGGELGTNEGQNIKMEYKLLNADFTFAAANQVTLPLIAVKNRRTNLFVGTGSDNLSSSYLFGDDANLHIKSYVTGEAGEKKDKKSTGSYAIYSIIETNSGKIHSFNMKAEDKNILEFNFTVSKNSIKIYGFFNDLSKGGTLNGIFTGSVDPKAFTISNLNFTYFTKSQLDALFAKDKEDANKGGLFTSKKEKAALAESLSSNFHIENVQSPDNDNLVLFCTKMTNYVRTVSNGTTTTTYPMCDKNNVTVFKINLNKGDIVWASNLDRRTTYSGWDVEDLKVISKDKNYYVVYGNSYNSIAGENGKTKKKSKSKDQRIDKFEYAVVDNTTGTIQRKEFTVNPINAQKEDVKFISLFRMDVIDNQIYVNSTKGRLKPLPTILSFIGCFVCPPVAWLPFRVPSYKKWTVYNGKISPM